MEETQQILSTAGKKKSRGKGTNERFYAQITVTTCITLFMNMLSANSLFHQLQVGGKQWLAIQLESH